MRLQKTGGVQFWTPLAGLVTFERAVAGVIVANAVVLVAGLMVDGHERLFEAAHNAIPRCVRGRVGVATAGGRLGVLAQPGGLFDAAVILLSCLPVLGVDAGLLRLARLARLLHLARHVSHLRLARVL